MERTVRSVNLPSSFSLNQLSSLLCLLSQAVPLQHYWLHTGHWSRQTFGLLVYYSGKPYLCCGLFYNRTLKISIFQSSVETCSSSSLIFSFCLDKHWTWRKHAHLECLWLFVKLVCPRYDPGHLLLITVSKQTASKECTCFEISEFLPLLLQDTDIELKSQITSVSRESMRTDQKPNSGWFLAAVSGFCNKYTVFSAVFLFTWMCHPAIMCLLLTEVLL